MQKILAEDYVVINYDAKKLSATLEWLRGPEGNEFRHVYSFLLDFIAENEIRSFIANIKMERVVYPEDRKWITNYVLPLACERGLKKVQIIGSDNIFKKFYLNILSTAFKKHKIDLDILSQERMNKKVRSDSQEIAL